MTIAGSAVGAMSALREQIEERLFQTEDYRALKALDKAIAEVQSAVPARLPNVTGSVNLSGHAPVQANPMTEHGLLQQKIADRFSNAAA